MCLDSPEWHWWLSVGGIWFAVTSFWIVAFWMMATILRNRLVILRRDEEPQPWGANA